MTVKAESNAKYISGALIIHALIAGVFIAASLYSPRVVIPELGIKAALVDSNSLNPPKKADPEPDVAEQQRQEEQKKQEQLEQERQKEKEREQEKVKEEQLRVEQQEKEKQAEQKRVADAQQEVKRQKQEAEKKRVEEIKQKQRDVENKRKQDADAKAQAAREAELKAQLADEEGRNQAVNAGLLNQYAALIRQRVERNWIKPPSAQTGIKCEVRVTQAVGGMVLSVSFGRCNADAAVRQSIESAVMRSSPLPPPSDSRLFDRNLSFIFNPAE
ncbi:MAG TPA: cell envelope integrity protein TolA [Steroidobacteraceae bacterium]|jgi:colicin import membrane protein|nr:cell envelope integrity protein TolA [Steroidobacteraceae bacterium]